MKDVILNEMLSSVVSTLQHPYQVTTNVNSNGSLSVLFFQKMALRLVSNKNGEFAEIHQDRLTNPDDPSTYQLEFERKPGGYVRFKLSSPSDLAFLSDAINAAWKDSARSLEQFGCCHLFVECSDAKKCLYEDESGEVGVWCWGCMYHWNLLAGRIFYGKNANINQVIKKGKSNQLYAVLDVELANSSEKGSICSIGIVWVDSNQIVDRFYSLVNPCCSFNSFCMDIHHITPQDVQDAPMFSQLWPQIYPKLKGIPLVSYNASADIYAIEKALFNAGISDDGLPYADAYRIVKRLFDFPSYKLSDVATRLGIKLDHAHNALADAEATANLMIFILNSFKFTGLKELLDFCGMDMQDTLSNTYDPACNIKPRNTAKKKRDIAPAIALSHGNSDYFAGKNVLFTGDLSCTTREMAQQAVSEMGGICKSGASKKINVCIVGSYDNETLCLGATMGIKLQKILEFKAQGCEIEIINESEFLRILEE